MAEGVLKHRAKKAGFDWLIESAGTNGYHVGEPPHHYSQKIASLNGIEICNQKARKFKAADFDSYNKIYAMAEDVMEEIKLIAGKKFDPAKADFFMNELYPGSNTEVPDPWSGPEAGYHKVYKMIDQVCDRMIEKYGLGSGY